MSSGNRPVLYFFLPITLTNWALEAPDALVPEEPPMALTSHAGLPHREDTSDPLEDLKRSEDEYVATEKEATFYLAKRPTASLIN